MAFSQMTVRIRRILVAIRDTQHVSRSQLRKAATLAMATGASIELFHAISEPLPLQAMRPKNARATGQLLRRAAFEKTTERLKRIKRSGVLRGVTAHTFAAWDYPAHQAIVRRVAAMKADLVVAAAQRKGIGSRLLLTNTDWQLIRECPCPLLIVKSSRDYKHPALLAAVDPFHAHAKPAQLDDRILKTGAAIVRALDGELHVFHAYVPLMVFLPTPFGQPSAVTPPRELEEMHAGQVTRIFSRLAEKARIPASRRHLRVGAVRGELVAVANRIRAGIAVLGAVSRSGLPRIFIGSTAESVLDALSCDLLIVKPKGFKSQMTRVRGPAMRARRKN